MNTPFKYISLALMTAVGASFASCVDKLDEVPDNRTEIDSPEKVALLLTSAYPYESPATILELSSDNLVDNNVVVAATHKSPYYDFHEEAYQWKDIENYSTGSSDTPYDIWEAYYAGISVTNHAIEAMKEMSEDPAHDPKLAPSWGEAHVLRAYMHFVLVNIFAEAYKNDAQSEADRGIPYVTIPETTVHVDYSTSDFLHSVKGTYDLIEKDLMEGLPCVGDNYTSRAFHFNRNAANAFAARFFLFKRDYAKAEQYATAALGTNPASMLRNWSNLNHNTAYTLRDTYWDDQLNCNFLIQSTYSLQWRMMVSSGRFTYNSGTSFTKDGVTYNVPNTMGVCVWDGSGPCWSGYLPCYSGCAYIAGGAQEYGAYLFRLIEFFEYTDKIAGIGYVHMLYLPFSAEETLLCRAEAKLYQGNREGAIEDLDFWAKSKQCSQDLTEARITRFYDRTKEKNDYISCMHPAEMGFSKVLTGVDQAVLDCVLHFRRIETIHGGDRWYDIKRYGISFPHFYRSANEDEIHVDSLTWNDPRRVLQLPKIVIESGYPASRPTTGGGGGGYQSAAYGVSVSPATDKGWIIPMPIK